MSDPHTPHQAFQQPLKNTKSADEPSAEQSARTEPRPEFDGEAFEARVLKGIAERRASGLYEKGENRSIADKEMNQAVMAMKAEELAKAKQAALDRLEQLKPPELPSEPAKSETIKNTR